MILITSYSTFIHFCTFLLNNNKIVVCSNTDSGMILLSKDGNMTKAKLAFGRQNHCSEVSKSKYLQTLNVVESMVPKITSVKA